MHSTHLHGFYRVKWKNNITKKIRLFGGPSFIPKYTPRSTFHRVNALEDTYALTFRGPWSNTWYEYNPNTKEYIEMTHGRKVINRTTEIPT